jgi:ribosomal protein L7/L12
MSQTLTDQVLSLVTPELEKLRDAIQQELCSRSRKYRMHIDFTGCTELIPTIKLLRNIAELGLKDAKDIVEAREPRTFDVIESNGSVKIEDAQRDFERFGCSTTFTLIT